MAFLVIIMFVLITVTKFQQFGNVIMCAVFFVFNGIFLSHINKFVRIAVGHALNLEPSVLYCLFLPAEPRHDDCPVVVDILFVGFIHLEQIFGHTP